jgi:protein involved in polysaccharide export with SLBB domain
MRLSKLIASAGGLTNKAYMDRAEVLRHEVKDGERVQSIHKVNLSKASEFIVKNYDEVTIYRIPKWHDRQEITLTGQVKFPGVYAFNDGDKLSDVLIRAGGFTNKAFLYGASFERESVKKIQQQALKDAMLRLKKKIAIMSTQSNEVGEGEIDKAELTETLSVLTEQGSELTPLGRVTINLSNDIGVLLGSSSDIVLKDGDSLNIPTFNSTVMVIGEVMSSTAVIYDDDDDVMSYIVRVGGLTSVADGDHIYVVHANGESEKFVRGLFLSSQVSVRPGDVIVVPQLLVTTTGIQVAKDISSILYQFAVTAASLKTVGAF